MIRIMTTTLLLTSQALLAQEAVVTLRSTVSGNQEQPKVMYIVPWQQPGDAEFGYELHSSFADELFVPVDRQEFQRGLEYQAMIETAGDSSATVD